jgi:hypothetical protein
MELRIEGLSKTYPGEVRALTDFSLTIGPGMLGLLGRTPGAGALADRAVSHRGPRGRQRPHHTGDPGRAGDSHCHDRGDDRGHHHHDTIVNGA